MHFGCNEKPKMKAEHTRTHTHTQYQYMQRKYSTIPLNFFENEVLSALCVLLPNNHSSV